MSGRSIRSKTGPKPARCILEEPAIFVASPGDVSHERNALKFWLEANTMARFGVRVFTYEHEEDGIFHSASVPQQQIPFPSDALIQATVCILSERLGSPVGEDFSLPPGFMTWLKEWQKPLGSPIRLPNQRRKANTIPMTGTLFELLDAIRGHQQQKTSAPLYIFVKGEEHTLPLRNWNDGRKLERIAKERKFGHGTWRSKKRDDYEDQLSLVDAVLRILVAKNLTGIETFSGADDLRVKISERLRKLFGRGAAEPRSGWRLSLEPLSSNDQESLFGRDDDIQKLFQHFRNTAKRSICVLHGRSGSGKSSVASAGFAARLRSRPWRFLKAASIETTPAELARDKTPLVTALAKRVAAVMDTNLADNLGASDIEIGAPVEIELAESIRADLAASPQNLPVIILDQAEQLWDSEGGFPEESRALLRFLQTLVEDRTIWCLLVLQSEPPERRDGQGAARQGGRLLSLRGINQGQPGLESIEITAPNEETAGEIAARLFEQQTGAILAPAVQKAIADSALDLIEQGVPYLPLLALRIDALTQAHHAATSIEEANDLDWSHARAFENDFEDIFTAPTGPNPVENWMLASLTSEIDDLGEKAVESLSRRRLFEKGDLSWAIDLCFSKLVDDAPIDADSRAEPNPDAEAPGDRPASASCIAREADQFTEEGTLEREVLNELVRFRVVRPVGIGKFRLSHLSVVDHWKRASSWFKRTKQRRAGISTARRIFDGANSPAIHDAALREGTNLYAIETLFSEMARNSPKLPNEILAKKEAIMQALAKAVHAEPKAVDRLPRVHAALSARFHQLVDLYLEPDGQAKALADATPTSKTSKGNRRRPFLHALLGAEAYDAFLRAVVDGCSRTEVDEEGASLLLLAASLGLRGIDIASTLLGGRAVPGKQPIPAMPASDQKRLLQTRTSNGRSFLDIAAGAGSAKALSRAYSVLEKVDPLLATGLLNSHMTFDAAPTPLYRACEAADPESVAFLIRKGREKLDKGDFEVFINSSAKISVPSIRSEIQSYYPQENETPLSLAARTGSIEIIRLLIDAGANPSVSGNCSENAFEAAMRTDRADVLAVLLERESGARKEVEAKAGIAHAAAFADAEKCLVFLLKERRWQVSDAYLRTPLSIACRHASTRTVEAILKTIPANVASAWIRQGDKGGETPLMKALLSARLSTVEHLLEHEAARETLNLPGGGGYRPLHYAARYCGASAIEILRQAGAQIEFEIEEGCLASPLHLAANRGDLASSRLLATERNLHQTNKHGRTALHVAARYGHVEIVQFLLEQGGDPNQTNDEGQTPLHLSSYYGHTGCVAALLVHPDLDVELPDKVQVDGQSKSGGRTALWSAALTGNSEIVQLLLARGANPNASDCRGRPAVEIAVKNNHGEVLKTLIDAGADLQRSGRGYFALEAAFSSGNLDAYAAIKHELLQRGTSLAAAIQTPPETGRSYSAFETMIRKLATAASALTAAFPDMPPFEDRFDEFNDDEGQDEGAGNQGKGTEFSYSGAIQILRDTLDNLGISALSENALANLLRFAITTSNQGLITLIAEHHSDIRELRDEFGNAAIHFAARTADRGMISRLVLLGQDINEPNGDGVTPLMTAAMQADEAILQSLLEFCAKQLNADIPSLLNTQDIFGETVLHKVCSMRFTEPRAKLRMLLSAGADANIRNIEGETPRGVLAFGLTKVIDPNVRAQIEFCRDLLDSYGGVEISRDLSSSRAIRRAWPLHSSLWEGRKTVVARMLPLARGFVRHARDPNGRSPWMVFCSAAQENYGPHVFESIWLGLADDDSNRCDKWGRTVQHYAAMASSAEDDFPFGTDRTLKRLAQWAEERRWTQLDWDICDAFGRTPLYIAASLGSDESCAWLLKEGASIGKADLFGWTPLHCAASQSTSAAYARLLQEAPSEVAAMRNNLGMTAMDIAARRHMAYPVNIEIEKGMGRAHRLSAGQRHQPRTALASAWSIGLLATVLIFAVAAFAPEISAWILEIRDRLTATIHPAIN